VRLRQYPLFVSVCVTMFYAGAVIAIAALGLGLKNHYGLNSFFLGCLLSCPTLGQAAVSLRAGRMSDRWGSARVANVGLIASALGLGMTATLPPAPLFFGLFVLAGAGAGAAFIAATSAVVQTSAPQRVGRATAIRQAAIPLGIMFWAPLFAATGAIDTPATGLLWLAIGGFLTAAIATQLPGKIERSAQPTTTNQSTKQPRLGGVMRIAGCWSLTQNGFSAFFVLLLIHEGTNAAIAALCFTAAQLGAAACRYATGAVIDRGVEPVLAIRRYGLASALGFIVLVAAAYSAPLPLFCAFAGITYVVSSSWSAAIVNAAAFRSPAAPGEGVAKAPMATAAGAIPAAPLLGGLLAFGGWPLTFAVCASFAALGSVFAWRESRAFVPDALT
jgi:predicted MFS family arabinose efflux permease